MLQVRVVSFRLKFSLAYCHSEHLSFTPDQDNTRTGAYFSAIIDNRSDFEEKTVMDVGAGSGILSLFAAQV